ncbi:MAG: MauE/DoxX family redox-associated membrane protein [Candidatus Neomarinimicrobiota bacterium]|nr:MauE/DoxX family redox-associated membrane protein [Candidatus Neomarinimicrobiota bacterium]
MIFRIVLGMIFIYASLEKIRDPGAFAGNIQNYQFLPYSLTNLLAILLPWVELYVGACLILGVFVDGAALLSAGMMVMFIVAIGQAIGRGLDIDCGCFKQADSSSVGIDTIARDVVWLAMSLLVWNRQEKTLEMFPKPRVDDPEKQD